MSYDSKFDRIGDRMVSANDVAELFGVSSQMVLSLPLKQIRLGPRTIRFKLSDVYEFVGVDNPNLGCLDTTS